MPRSRQTVFRDLERAGAGDAGLAREPAEHGGQGAGAQATWSFRMRPRRRPRATRSDREAPVLHVARDRWTTWRIRTLARRRSTQAGYPVAQLPKHVRCFSPLAIGRDRPVGLARGRPIDGQLVPCHRSAPRVARSRSYSRYRASRWCAKRRQQRGTRKHHQRQAGLIHIWRPLRDWRYPGRRIRRPYGTHPARLPVGPNRIRCTRIQYGQALAPFNDGRDLMQRSLYAGKPQLPSGIAVQVLRPAPPTRGDEHAAAGRDRTEGASCLRAGRHA